MPLHVLEQEGHEVFRASCDQCEVQGELASRSEEALRGFFLCQGEGPTNERASDSVTLCDACYRMNIGFPSARPEAVIEEVLTTLQQVQGAEMVDIRPGSFMRTLVEVMVRQFTDVQGLQHRLIQELGRTAQAPARTVEIPVAVDLTINVETPEGVDGQRIRELVEARLREELAHPIRTVHAAAEPEEGIAQAIQSSEGRQRLAQAMINPLRRRLDYAGVARAAFPVEQMPPGAVPIYNQDPVDPIPVPDWVIPGCLVRHRERSGSWRVVEVADDFIVLTQDGNRWPWSRRLRPDFTDEFYRVLPKNRYEHILGE